MPNNSNQSGNAKEELLPNVDKSFFETPHAWETTPVEESNNQPQSKRREKEVRNLSPSRVKGKGSPKKNKSRAGSPPKHNSVFDRLGAPNANERTTSNSPPKKSVFDRLGSKGNSTEDSYETHSNSKSSIFDRLGPKDNTTHSRNSTNERIHKKEVVKSETNSKTKDKREVLTPNLKKRNTQHENKSKTLDEKPARIIEKVPDKYEGDWAEIDDEFDYSVPKWD
ncbi:hypothetical protein HDV02_005242 [Globomyces sp. JEL0801]|nr:hypothetical protein HDV02_005242 [Globomyces sp. JEL0801]